MTDGATIFALSSGAPPAAIGVVRISGPQAGAALDAFYGRITEPRRATLGWIRDPRSGERLDQALLLWFPGPSTATGEDLAELHLHGGRAVVDAVLEALASVPGLRRAEAGEFTRRAFANGVLDLSEAEGLADLLSAETASQRRNAQQLLGGALSRSVAIWQGRLLGLSAQLEAAIEFGEDDDIPLDPASVGAEVRGLCQEIGAALAVPAAERLKDGVKVVLAGPPNAGKSTLMNAIVGREAAITSDIAGTTRDLIEATVAIGGIPFLFVDTAGLHEQGTDAIERIGMDRARDVIETSDILLWLGPLADAPDHPGRLVVQARCDLPGRDQPNGADVAVSAQVGTGLDRLVDELLRRGRRLLPGGGEVALNRRQRDVLAECEDALDRAGRQVDPILMAEDLRAARVSLDRLTGVSGVEDMLDALFGRFCIGK